MINVRPFLRLIMVWSICCLLAGETFSQQPLPPLPDQQMEIATFGYRINGRFHMLWFPGQASFRDEFTINEKAMHAYREYLKTAYWAKGTRWIGIGAMASLFFVDHTELSAGLTIAAGALGGVISVPLSGLKRARLEEAVDLRNAAWYRKVRE